MKIYFAIGSPDKMRVDTFTQCGVQRVLISYGDSNGKANINLPFSDVMLDSGAFGVETGTQKVTPEAYALWLELYLSQYPQIKTYVNLDALNDPETSAKNQQYLESCGLAPMPVYHHGEPIEYLDEICSKYKYVGLGGMAVGKIRSEDLRTFWERIYERYKDNIFHLFGTMAMPAMIKYQPYSLDSSSWASAGKYRSFAGYKDGIPAWFKMAGENNGWQFFFKSTELWSLNIRAMLDWEKLEWLKNVKSSGNGQQRML